MNQTESRVDTSQAHVEVITEDQLGGSGLADEEEDELLDLATANKLSALDVSSDADPVATYMARLQKVEPLPADEQQELARRYLEEDDMDAAKLLILTNLRLVVKLAKEYKRRWADMLDLVQEGNVGLAEAVTRYDPYRGVKFTSYAQYWIRAMILNYLMNFVHPVRIGGSRAGRKLFYNLKKTRRELSRRGIKPTARKVAEYLQVDEKEVVRVGAQLDAPPVALDAPAPGYDGTTVGQLMEGEGVGPEDAYAEYEISSQIEQAINDFGDHLDEPRARAIWQERMIVDDRKTLKELGKDWDVSKERIRQVEVEIREEFRQFLLDRVGDDVKISWLEPS
ncbi:MAG: RNA polymerase sigma factor RpoD/SigA [Persicimonas sp.]